MLLQVICPQKQLVTLGALDLALSARHEKVTVHSCCKAADALLNGGGVASGRGRASVLLLNLTFNILEEADQK